MATRPLAIVTGASSGIGYELARCCAEDGHDLIIAANEPEIEKAADELRAIGATVETVNADLSTTEGNDAVLAKLGGREIDLLCANAGRGLGHGFLDQDWKDMRYVIDTNVVGTTYLLQKVGQKMRTRNKGRILITGSIAGLMPGSFQAVYNGTKAYLDSLSWAIRNELKETEVTVTCLMPGPTDTPFFDRAGMMDTNVGQSDSKEDPAITARNGYEAMKKGKSGIVSGFMNKVQATFAGIIPESVLAEMHRKMAEPQDEKEAAKA